MSTVRRTLRYWQGATVGVTGSTMAQSVGADQISVLVGDFAHYADLYQEYRILGVKVYLVPQYSETPSIFPAGALGSALPPIQAAAFSGISAVSAITYTVQELADAQSFRMIPGASHKMLVCSASANMNPTAKLWFQTGGTVSNLGNIGVVWSLAGVCPAPFNGSPIWTTLFEWDIEFRGAL